MKLNLMKNIFCSYNLETPQVQPHSGLSIVILTFISPGFTGGY